MADDGFVSLDGQHDKYVGLMLAVSSSLMIGISFVITKKGLIDSTSRHGGHGSASEQYLFLKNPIWLLGMLTSNDHRFYHVDMNSVKSPPHSNHFVNCTMTKP